MLPLGEAQARLLADVIPLPAESIELSRATGRYLAQDVTARLTQPPFAASAMDGYAIRWDDLPGPWRVVGESAAGSGWQGAARTGEAVRIFTGAPLPDGTDTVIVQEDVARDGELLRLTRDGPPHRGAHIRQAGLDFEAGQLLLRAGVRLSSATIGLCAAAGHGGVDVRRRPKVAILSTGDELVPPGVPPGPDQIVSSNGLLLSSLIRDAGGIPIDLGIVRDDRDAISEALTQATSCDLLVTVGGASVGDRDLVIPALQAAGAAIDFWKIAIRPGKPMLAGRLGDTQVVGLPGNPVSAFVCAVLFVLPLLRAWQGDPTPVPAPVSARTVTALSANGPRQDHVRARLTAGPDGLSVEAARVQDSSMLSVLASSNALIVRSPNAPAAPAGELVPVLTLDSFKLEN